MTHALETFMAGTAPSLVQLDRASRLRRLLCQRPRTVHVEVAAGGDAARLRALAGMRSGAGTGKVIAAGDLLG
jgi:hypothetical protein